MTIKAALRSTVTPARVYNASVVGGIAMASVGAAEVWGRGIGLLFAGALVLAFTVYAAERLIRTGAR